LKSRRRKKIKLRQQLWLYLQKSAASWLAGQKTIICVNGGGGLVVYIYSKATGNHPPRPHPRPPTRTKAEIKWGRRKKGGKTVTGEIN